jgi:hypothetical protein
MAGVGCELGRGEERSGSLLELDGLLGRDHSRRSWVRHRPTGHAVG